MSKLDELNAAIDAAASGPDEKFFEAVAAKDEYLESKRYKVFLCPQCGNFHKPGYIVECRDDNHRWTGNELDDKFGPDGWVEVPEQGEQG